MTLYSGGAGGYDTEGGIEFTERVVHIRRVAKVVKGGRHLSFNAMVVVGDGRGRVGVGLGKGTAVPDAVRKGNSIARRELVLVPLRGSTIPHTVRAGYGASHVLIKPAPAGAGIVAGGALRAVMEAAGIRDVVAKALGSRNPINVVKATLEGLQMLQGEITEEQLNAPSPVAPAPVSRRDGQGGRPRPRRSVGGPRGIAAAEPAGATAPQAARVESEAPVEEVETAEAIEALPAQPAVAREDEAPSAEGGMSSQAAEDTAPEVAGAEAEGTGDAQASTTGPVVAEAPEESPAPATEEAEAPATGETEGSEDGKTAS